MPIEALEYAGPAVGVAVNLVRLAVSKASKAKKAKKSYERLERRVEELTGKLRQAAPNPLLEDALSRAAVLVQSYRSKKRRCRWFSGAKDLRKVEAMHEEISDCLELYPLAPQANQGLPFVSVPPPPRAHSVPRFRTTCRASPTSIRCNAAETSMAERTNGVSSNGAQVPVPDDALLKPKTSQISGFFDNDGSGSKNLNGHEGSDNGSDSINSNVTGCHENGQTRNPGALNSLNELIIKTHATDQALETISGNKEFQQIARHVRLIGDMLANVQADPGPVLCQDHWEDVMNSISEALGEMSPVIKLYRQKPASMHCLIGVVLADEIEDMTSEINCALSRLSSLIDQCRTIPHGQSFEMGSTSNSGDKE